MRRGATPDQFARRGLGISRCDVTIHQAELERALGADVLAGEHHVHGPAHAEQPHQAHGAAEAGMNPQLHFGQAQRQLAVVDTDAIAAGQRQLQATTQRKAVEDRHSGAGQCREPVTDALSETDRRQRLVHRTEGGELVDVRPGDETAGLARAQDQPLGRLAPDLLQ